MSGSEVRARPATPVAPDAPDAGPARSGRIILAFAGSPAERRAVEDWLLRDRTDGERAPEMLEAGDHFLGARLLERDDDPEITPVRVHWLPIDRDGSAALHLKDILTLTDPRHPRP